MTDVLDDLVDLHNQATTERSHYYVASRCRLAIDEIRRLRKVEGAARASVKDERDTYPEDPPRWADCGCAGPLTEKLADALSGGQQSGAV